MSSRSNDPKNSKSLLFLRVTIALYVYNNKTQFKNLQTHYLGFRKPLIGQRYYHRLDESKLQVEDYKIDTTHLALAAL
jgi:hypothetical protein